jgi:hypothetical protein
VNARCRKSILCASFCVQVVWAALAAATSGGDGSFRKPLCVEVDRHANVYLDGICVDTLLVRPRQWIRWEKRSPSGPDLTIQFERGLVDPRHPVRIRVSNTGKPATVEIDIHARERMYVGRPQSGFVAGLPAYRVLWLRVVPPPGG